MGVMDARLTEIEVQGADLVGAVFGSLARGKLIAKTVNDLAFMARPGVVTEMGRALELRNRFSAAGIQVAKANPEDASPEARVGIEERRSYLVDHVTGGKREGGRFGRAILAEEALRGPTGRVPRGKRPGSMVKAAKRAEAAQRGSKRPRGRQGNPLPFLIYSRKFRNEVLVRRQGKDRYPLQILYAFRKGVTIREEFDMVGEVARTVGANHDAVYGRHLARVIAGAKSKADRANSMSAGLVIDRGR